MISKEVIKEHLKEVEYKAIACETNINNVNAMLESIEKDLKTCNKDQEKTLSIAKDQYKEELEKNKKALEMHLNNITYLNNRLWI